MELPIGSKRGPPSPLEQLRPVDDGLQDRAPGLLTLPAGPGNVTL
jgi:hypothetical protein